MGRSGHQVIKIKMMVPTMMMVMKVMRKIKMMMMMMKWPNGHLDDLR